MLSKANLIIDIFQQLKQLPFVEDTELIATPSDVEADLSLLLKVKNWDMSYIRIISKLIDDLEWKAFDKTGDMPIIHWDYRKV